ncbi:MAG: histidine phosphatase family protein [Micropruina sp.]|uniref:histidine phosphatase family protein n=1 Tax=Micropruina sp. TaxID=2737536 RepID=UPI0039E49B93
MKPFISRAALAAALTLAAGTLSAGASASGAVPQRAAAPESGQQAASPAIVLPEHPHGQHDRTVTIYLTRHGQTILNTLERVQGWIDSPLVVGTNRDGSVLDARILPVTVGTNVRARDGRFDAAYSADMKRHQETARYLLEGARQKLKISKDAGLREVNFGKYEGAENKEMWTDIVEHLGYTVNHDAPATAPVDTTGQNGGWQTMQLLAVNEKGVAALMAAMKELAETPTETGVTLPAENCTDVSKRMMASLNSIAKKAVRNHDKRVLVVSSGLSITCAVDSLGTRVTTAISNVAISKLEYTKGVWTVKSVGDTSYRQ